MNKCAVFFLLALCAASAWADVIDTRAMQPWESCAYCHGADGHSAAARFPRLAAQPPAYLSKQLRDFRAGRRGNDDGVMQDNAATLAEADVDRVAAHFAAQTPQPRDESKALPQFFVRGDPVRRIASCAGCHGDEGEGRGESPRLGGQHAAYLQKQLNDFAAGKRRNDPGAGLHRGFAKALRAAEIKSLSEALGAAP